MQLRSTRVASAAYQDIKMERLSALSARLLPREGQCDAVSHSAEILDYLTPCAGLRAATSGKLTVGPRPVLVTLKYESQAIYKGSPFYARFAAPAFFTFSCFLGAVTLTSLSSPSPSSLLSLSSSPGARRCCKYILQ